MSFSCSCPLPYVPSFISPLLPSLRAAAFVFGKDASLYLFVAQESFESLSFKSFQPTGPKTLAIASFSRQPGPLRPCARQDRPWRSKSHIIRPYCSQEPSPSSWAQTAPNSPQGPSLVDRASSDFGLQPPSALSRASLSLWYDLSASSPPSSAPQSLNVRPVAFVIVASSPLCRLGPR